MSERKIRIRRQASGWHVTRPAFGFGSSTTTVYPTWDAVKDACAATSAGSAAQIVEQSACGYSHGLRHWSGFEENRPRWFEAVDCP